MKEVLQEKYFNHWCLFVLGITLLLGHSISQPDLALAAYCFTKFSEDFEPLYGSKMSTFFCFAKKKKKKEEEEEEEKKKKCS